MDLLKKLAGQTAVYGLSNIVGRLLGYLLVPLYTRLLLPEEYGVVTGIYAYVSFLLIVFTYGLETAYFKFASKHEEKTVFGTCLVSIISSSTLIATGLILFRNLIATELQFPNHPEYVTWFALILSFDAITAIPFVRLRMENRAKKFALFKFLNIVINIGFNLWFLIACPYLIKKGINVPFYDPSIKEGYIFISNLIASGFTLLILLPEIFKSNIEFKIPLWQEILIYALPLLPAGLAGMVNETFDRIMIIKLIPDPKQALYQSGIYGACYKLSILMTLFRQTFIYAAEPFFFAQSGKENAKESYIIVMKYFAIMCCLIFLGVMVNIDVVKYFLGERYYSGLHIVPVLLLANMFLGIYVNLSIWYKLSGHTHYGAYISVIAAVITIILNLWWIPIFGYTGAAWTTLICYALMMCISYFFGQKFYPVNYNIKNFLTYLILSVSFYLIHHWIFGGFSFVVKIVTGNIFVLVFLTIAYVLERKKIVTSTTF